jgi:hypothetical protein
MSSGLHLYVPRKLVDQTIEFLDLPAEMGATKRDRIAKLEIDKQCQRLYTVYRDTQRSAKRERCAIYWSPVDTYALYTLTSCQYLSRNAANRALRDLNIVEAELAKLRPSELATYNKFVLFLESLTAAPRKLPIAKFHKRLEQWAASFNGDQQEYMLALLKQFVPGKTSGLAATTDASTGFLARSVTDAVTRVRSATHPAIRARFAERYNFIVTQWEELVKHPEPPTITTSATPLPPPLPSVAPVVQPATVCSTASVAPVV